jgi:2-polyprenyl-6-methoxyphenol hydroxylase-like FAD-dependent oxidoreductase
MSVIGRALIIGGGIAGMAASIELRKRGVAVDLVEIDPKWRVYGAGITINGAALRAFKTLGVVQQIVKLGACSDGCDICAPNGMVVAKLPTPRIAGADIPGSGGILRPVLARILSQSTRAAGVRVRLGVTFDSIEQQADFVKVKFTDGSSGKYDLVVGSDGLYSKVRAAVIPDALSPKYTGQGMWRATVPRLPEIKGACIFMGRVTRAGLNPVSRDEMYLFVTDERALNERIPTERWLSILKGLLTEFGGPIGKVRDILGEQARILYRPLEALLVSAPWHRGRVVLIGDAVHATTPHLTAGAAIGLEDAVVLAETLEQSSTLEAALQAYSSRRFERCRMVVENSLRLGEIESTGGSKEEHGKIMRQSMVALAGAVP